MLWSIHFVFVLANAPFMSRDKLHVPHPLPPLLTKQGVENMPCILLKATCHDKIFLAQWQLRFEYCFTVCEVLI